MTLHLQPVRVATSSEDSDGQLVFVDGFLVAVLVHLSGQHGANAGMWFLEAGFGLTAVMSAPLFLDVDAAQDWIGLHLGIKRIGAYHGSEPELFSQISLDR